MNLPIYELFAVRYATREARRSDNVVGGDPHDRPMPMDYFVWSVRNQERCILIDTRFTAETAARRKRTYLRTPTEGLAALGIQRLLGGGGRTAPPTRQPRPRRR
jgi:hypothetical protein